MKVEIFFNNGIFFSAANDYKNWIQRNQNVEIINIITDKSTIVVTYKETQ